MKKYRYEKNYTSTRPPFVKLVNGLPKYVRVPLNIDDEIIIKKNKTNKKGRRK